MSTTERTYIMVKVCLFDLSYAVPLVYLIWLLMALR